MLIRASDFKAVHGMSTQFWGWGREDDEFQRRLDSRGCPEGAKEGRHVHAHGQGMELGMGTGAEKGGVQRCPLHISRADELFGIKRTKSAFKHVHDARSRPRDIGVDSDKHRLKNARDVVIDRSSGLETAEHTITRVETIVNVVTDMTHVEVDVALQCDQDKTPWCNPAWAGRISVQFRIL